MENQDIARIFDQVADLLEIQGENPFRIRAYRTAARTVESSGVQMASLAEKGDKALERLPGIGRDLAGKIVEIVKTGRLPLFDELARKTPETLVALLRISGLGPKRARLIYETLGVETLAALEKAAREGRLRGIKGIGETIEQTILRGIAQDRVRQGRFRLAEAEASARPIVELLQATPGVDAVAVAGSFRRRCDTVGDLDILVTARRPAAVGDRFVSAPGVGRILAHGDTKCSVVLKSGLQVDLRVVPAKSFGAALYYFTGSKAHNIAVRTLGVKQKLKVNEYGVFKGTRQIAGRDEAGVFKAVGLPWIPPELRENRGEVEAAREGRLPRLVELQDIRGDLQMHTTATDGKHSLEQMVDACAERGYEYLAITDHTAAVRVARGMSREGFLAQFREIDSLRRRRSGGPTILKGAEVDILEDGSLDLDEGTLAELDVVVASVHSKFTLPKAAMTRRIVRALKHPRVQILGHPTGRLIGRREPVALDFEQVVAAARDHGVLLEINSLPDRLDLNDVAVYAAREAGVKLVVSTDAHRTEELGWMRFGVDQARRGWCTPDDVANTRSVKDLLGLLRR